jgi:hypothetical protein
MSRMGLGIVIAVAVLFIAGVLTLAAVAARQETQELTPVTGSPPARPPSPADGPSGPTGDDSAGGARTPAGWVRTPS